MTTGSHAKPHCSTACAFRRRKGNVRPSGVSRPDDMTRIAVGGFLHETNTFAPTKATYDAFLHGGGWPSMTLGADVLKVMRRINVGLAGFAEAAGAYGWELVPTIACGASPSAHVTRDAFERIVPVIVEGIKSAGSLHGVFFGQL